MSAGLRSFPNVLRTLSRMIMMMMMESVWFEMFLTRPLFGSGVCYIFLLYPTGGRVLPDPAFLSLGGVSSYKRRR